MLKSKTEVKDHEWEQKGRKKRQRKPTLLLVVAREMALGSAMALARFGVVLLSAISPGLV